MYIYIMIISLDIIYLHIQQDTNIVKNNDPCPGSFQAMPSRPSSPAGLQAAAHISHHVSLVAGCLDSPSKSLEKYHEPPMNCH